MVPQRRKRIEPTDDWQQLELRVESAGQWSPERIRPVVLFGHSPAERSAATGTAERTLHRQIARFAQLSMATFVPSGLPQYRLAGSVVS